MKVESSGFAWFRIIPSVLPRFVCGASRCSMLRFHLPSPPPAHHTGRAFSRSGFRTRAQAGRPRNVRSAQRSRTSPSSRCRCLIGKARDRVGRQSAPCLPHNHHNPRRKPVCGACEGVRVFGPGRVSHGVLGKSSFAFVAHPTMMLC